MTRKLYVDDSLSVYNYWLTHRSKKTSRDSDTLLEGIAGGLLLAVTIIALLYLVYKPWL